MENYILKGNLCYSEDQNHIRLVPNGYLVCVDGRSAGMFETLPERYASLPVVDYGDRLIIPGLIDLHIHAPQFAFRGLGMDMELLDWLNTYTFPEESKYAEMEYAQRAYSQFAAHLRRSATTRAGVFATLHLPATEYLMRELERSGLVSYVGKVNMDRNGLPGVLEETSEASMRDTLRWLDRCQDTCRIHPILTPRFTPSCTDKLMEFLGRLAAERGLPVQSHLSENRAEIQWVRELHPDCEQYWETYAKYGLWNDRTLMAHCVWSDEWERQAMKNAGVTVVHCPDSNLNLCSGTAPVRTMLTGGVRVALGSDIAGGDHLDMFDVTAAAIRASKIRRMTDPAVPAPLTVAEAWYLATSAGAEWFGEQPGFAPGNALHAMVLSDSALPHGKSLTPAQRLERAVYRRQPNALRAVYSAGRKVFEAPAD